MKLNPAGLRCIRPTSNLTTHNLRSENLDRRDAIVEAVVIAGTRHKLQIRYVGGDFEALAAEVVIAENNGPPAGATWIEDTQSFQS